MATATLSVDLRTNGAGKVSADLKGVTQSASSAEKAVDRLSNTMGRVSKLLALGGFAALAKSVLSMADTMKSLNTQVKFVTDSTAEFTQVNKELFAIAQNTRSSYEATTQTFVKTKRALADLGITSNQTLKFTDTLNKAMAVGGVGAEQQASALMQLSQALGSGVLQGDEFKAIAENAPIILDVVAEYMGKSRQEVKKLAAEGEITSKVIVEAISGASGKINEKFAQMPLTFGGAIQQLSNAWLQFTDNFNTSGISGAVASVISAIALNFATLAKAVIYATGAYAAWVATAAMAKFSQGVGAVGALARSFANLTVMVRGATAAMLANPLGLLATAIATAAFAFDAFIADMTFGASEIGTTWGDVAVGVWEDFTKWTSQTVDTVLEYWDSATSKIEGFWGGLTEAFLSVYQVVAEATVTTINQIIGIFVAGFDAISIAWGDLPNTFLMIGKLAINGLISVIENGLNYLASGLSAFLGLFNSAANAVGMDNLFDVSGMKIELPKLELSDTQNQIKNDLGSAINAALSRDYIGDSIDGVTNYLKSAGDKVRNRKNQEVAYNAPADKALKELTGGKTDKKGGKSGKGSKSLEDYRNEWDKFYDDLVNKNASAFEKIKYEQDVANRELEKHLKHGVVTQEEAEKARTLIAEQYAKQRRELAGQYAPDIAALLDQAKQLKEINQLLQAGELTALQADFAAAKIQSKTATSIAENAGDMAVDPMQQIRAKYDPVLELQNQQSREMAILQSYYDQKILKEDEYQRYKAQLVADYNSQILQKEQEMYSQTFQAMGGALDSMAGVMKNAAGEQSGIYQAMFAASKAFAIADSILKIQQGIANAAAAPFPANLAAMASVAAATANIVSTIQSVSMGSYATGGLVGFEQGGYTGVGGKYEPAGIVHKGEYVITKEATTRLGRGFLDQLNYGKGYANGGIVGDNSASTLLPVSMPTFTHQPNSTGATNNVTITVNIDQSGEADSKTDEQSSQQAKELGKMIESKVLEVIVKQKRNGGMLA